MDSKEILQQYIIGAMNSKSAIAELEKNLADTSTLLKIQEAARARYVIGFIRRAVQYRCDEASATDFCLNLRDVILVLGRIKLNEKLYEAARAHASEFDLVCENDYHVSCIHHIPSWLEPHQYIKDVYALRHTDGIEMERASAGDAVLESHTFFKAYKSFEQKVAVQSSRRAYVAYFTSYRRRKELSYTTFIKCYQWFNYCHCSYRCLSPGPVPRCQSQSQG